MDIVSKGWGRLTKYQLWKRTFNVQNVKYTYPSSVRYFNALIREFYSIY